MNWKELPLYQKVLAVVISTVAIITVTAVFGWGRLWFRKK